MCYLKFIAVQISSHTARHTVLTNLVSNGVLSLPDIAHLAGHRDTEMLIKVYHPSTHGYDCLYLSLKQPV